MNDEALAWKINTVDDIYTKLEENNEINFFEYNKYTGIAKEIKEVISDMSPESNESNRSKGRLCINRLLLEKILKGIEKIHSKIKHKKEYEFISDYFITEMPHSHSVLPETQICASKGHNDGLLDTWGDDPMITDDYLSELRDIDTTSAEDSKIKNLLSLCSHSYIVDKLKLSTSEAETIKYGLKHDNIGSKNNISSHANSEIINRLNKIQKNKSKKTTLPCLTRGKLDLFKTSKCMNNNNDSTNEIDKELEEEINNQIFRYTKSMKENAKNFNSQLRQDNKTLEKIETIQNVDKDKTDTQMKRLKEFNFSLSIGFFKMIFMIIVVIVTFVFTLLIMRVFPKLV